MRHIEFTENDDNVSALTCPFCGNEPTLTHITMLGVPHYHKYRIVCQRCYAGIEAASDTEEEAIKRWNTRYEPPTPGGIIVPAGNARYVAKKMF